MFTVCCIFVDGCMFFFLLHQDSGCSPSLCDIGAKFAWQKIKQCEINQIYIEGESRVPNTC